MISYMYVVGGGIFTYYGVGGGKCYRVRWEEVEEVGG